MIKLQDFSKEELIEGIEKSSYKDNVMIYIVNAKLKNLDQIISLLHKEYEKQTNLYIQKLDDVQKIKCECQNNSDMKYFNSYMQAAQELLWIEDRAKRIDKLIQEKTKEVQHLKKEHEILVKESK